MNDRKKALYLAAVVLIFLIVLGIRWKLAFRYSEFTDDSSYFILRQVDHIKETGLPLYEDSLSYGGRSYVFLPLYHYILAFFSLFIPVYSVLKIIPNVFAASLVIVVYLLSYETTKSRMASLLSSIVAGFIPIYMSETINTASVSSVLVPLIVLLLYFYIRLLKDKEYIGYFAVTLFTTVLISPYSLLFLVGLVFYFILSVIEKKRIAEREMEVFLFSLMFYIWLVFVVFKKSLLAEGTGFVWKSIPDAIVANYFSGMDPLTTIYSVGALPLLFGIYITYFRLFEEKKKVILVLIGFLVGVGLLSWLRLVENRLGLTILGAVLAVLFADSMKSLFVWMKKTKFSEYRNLVVAVVFILVIATSAIPAMDMSFTSLREKTPKEDEVKALNWLSLNTMLNSTVLASPDEGHKIAFISDRKNVMDSNYVLANRPEKRFEDIRKIFTSISKVEAIDLCERYGIDYIYLSKKTLEEINQDGLNFVDVPEDDCFKMVYDEEPLIYEVRCKVREQR